MLCYFYVIDTQWWWTKSSCLINSQIWLASLIQDTSEIALLDELLELNCNHKVHVHLLVKHDSLKLNRDEKKCAPWIVDFEPLELTTKFANTSDSKEKGGRIPRISALRKYQRQQLRKLLGQHDVLIVMDVDLLSLGPNGITLLLKEIQRLKQQPSSWDAVCAAGVECGNRYYDSYATVLYPDTFVFPRRWRYNASAIGPIENSSLILAPRPTEGLLTQVQLFNHLQSSQRGSNPVQVRSCFGGLAIYRSQVYFANECDYQLENDKPLYNLIKQKYAATHGQVCEHVVLHECLHQHQQHNNKFLIGIQPQLQTQYHANGPGVCK